MSKHDFREYRPGESIRNGERTYIIEDRISHGKFGCVFACRDDWGHARILRVVWSFSRSDESLRARWEQHATGVQRLHHPGLVYIHDSFEYGGSFHLVEERCDHRLDRYIVSPVWDGARWLKAVAREVLCSLDFVHRAGYTHQNLHPHNVFCAVPFAGLHPDALFSGAIKLGDFGVNTLLGSLEIINARMPRWLVPPEYLNPSELGAIDHRVDIYQAGLLLLCVLQGRIVRYSFEQISAGLPAQNAESLGSDHGQMVARALRLKPAERFGSALEFWRALAGSLPTPQD